MDTKIFDMEQAEQAPAASSTKAFDMKQGASVTAPEVEQIPSDVFSPSSLSSFERPNYEDLAAVDALSNSKIHSIPIPKDSDLSADLPDDDDLQKLINQEIKFNQKIASNGNPETLTNALSAAIRGVLKRKPKSADSLLGQLQHNNVIAIERANMINKAIVRHQNSDINLKEVLAKKGIPLEAEAIKKAVKSDKEVSHALDMSKAARLDLFNQVASPEAQRSIQVMKESGLLGRKAESNLDSALVHGADELEKDSTNKKGLESISEKMEEMMSSISDFIDNLFSRNSAATPS